LKENRVQIRYRNTLNDLVALQKYVLRHTDEGKKMMRHRFLMVEAIVVAIAAIFAINHDRMAVLLGFLLATALAWLFRERSVVLQFKKDFKRERRRDESGLFDRDRIVSVDDRGMSVRTGPRHIDYTWDQLQMIGRDNKYIYIVLRGILHYVVPISAFNDQQASEAFFESIQGHLARGQKDAARP
jgi:hypothetical protein